MAPGPQARSSTVTSGGSSASMKENITLKHRSRSSMYTHCWASQRRSQSAQDTAMVPV